MKQKMDIRVINAIATAGIRSGGIHNLEMPQRLVRFLCFRFVLKRKKWHDCIGFDHLWYNDATTHSTGAVKL